MILVKVEWNATDYRVYSPKILENLLDDLLKDRKIFCFKPYPAIKVFDHKYDYIMEYHSIVMITDKLAIGTLTTHDLSNSNLIKK
jgi:hypothetical protein